MKISIEIEKHNTEMSKTGNTLVTITIDRETLGALKIE
jgi:hypothetical protein